MHILYVLQLSPLAPTNPFLPNIMMILCSLPCYPSARSIQLLRSKLLHTFDDFWWSEQAIANSSYIIVTIGNKNRSNLKPVQLAIEFCQLLHSLGSGLKIYSILLTCIIKYEFYCWNYRRWNRGFYNCNQAFGGRNKMFAIWSRARTC